MGTIVDTSKQHHLLILILKYSLYITMAKSIRSKRKRVMRNIKREKVYGPKELARLKKTLDTPDTEDIIKDEEMVIVRDAKELVKEKEEAAETDTMETNQDKKFDKKTLMDQDGQYLPWMNQRRIKKQRTTNNAKKN